MDHMSQRYTDRSRIRGDANVADAIATFSIFQLWSEVGGLNAEESIAADERDPRKPT